MYTMEEFRDDVAAVVAYIWSDNERDYKACLRADHGAEGHIFLTLKRLADFVDGEDEPEFCYECGADIPLHDGSVRGDWHERSCSRYLADAGDPHTSIDNGAGSARTTDAARTSNANGGGPGRQGRGRVP